MVMVIKPLKTVKLEEQEKTEKNNERQKAHKIGLSYIIWHW